MREQSAASRTLRRRIILRQRVARQPCCRGARCFCVAGAVVSATTAPTPTRSEAPFFVVMTTLAVNEVHRQNEVINTKITSLVAFGGSSNYTNGSLVWSAVGKTFALRLKSREC